jgi:hypothetical protein
MLLKGQRDEGHTVNISNMVRGPKIVGVFEGVCQLEKFETWSVYLYVYLQDIICIHQWNSWLSGSIGHLPVPGKGRMRFVSIQTWMMTKDIKHVYIIYRRTI